VARPPIQGAAGARQSQRAAASKRPPAERRRSPSSARVDLGADAGTITLTVMRAMVASSDALRSYLETHNVVALSAADLASPGSTLAELARHYQSALRHFVKDWLRDRRQMAWRVDAFSGRTLAIDDDAAQRGALAADTDIVLAEDQPLHGIRQRSAREGLGIPVAARTRRAAPDPVLDPARTTAARPWTVLVSVAGHDDRRLRRVRIEILDPGEAPDFLLGATRVPLAADFTAPVALTLGLERRPAAIAYGLRGTTRRGTVEGFSALTPFGLQRAPLVLMEGVGLSLTTMAQLTNEVAADPLLRSQYQVWLYRYPVTAPLCYAARAFRADLERFAARFAGATGRDPQGRVTVIARGAGAVIAKSLLADCGTALWNAIFSVAPQRLDVDARDRVLLDGLLRWHRAAEIDRIVVLDEPRSAEALLAGVGTRAVQLLLRQPAELRGAIERIYGREKAHLAAPSPTQGASSTGAHDADAHPEPVCAAVAAAALATDRALLALVADDGRHPEDAKLYRGGAGLRAVESLPAGAAGIPGELPAVRRALEWLRPPP